MLPLQRRTLAACIFAFAFILFFEARGQRLVSAERQETTGSFKIAEQQYWEQTGTGMFVLIIGTLLIVTLRRPGQTITIPRGELIVYALALGALLGTAVVSWMIVSRLRNGT